ncbi:TAXI family TRAP transporter solute-binding subunit [Dichotomicrobium thermohalophilum]|uniref:TRAP transporter TAXI family solute receptor n=1 Tax=Dichotomicrobium thermohalophilum TaxID=933063 RepID=A0A397Q8W7_9HYPH|nr:TAXI family TRAP transporter solute-binding subunit [Dichotomicrobium thermohalophilum]RIA55977.1 TRAP transporter TAXI family solute receptor [Dichotomicrobium thermohalophilum]
MPARISLGKLWVAVILILCSSLATSGPLSAQTETDYQEMVERVNRGTVRVISGGIGGTYIRIATDLASVLNDGNRLRVLPIVGQGSVQNITDLLYLKGIDIGIVQSDVLSFIKRRNMYPGVEERIAYITKLYNEELHVVGGPEIGSIEDLAGRKVNFGVEGSGTAMTAETVFESLGIEVEPVYHDQPLALQKIKDGEIAATLYVAGKPTSAIEELNREDGYRLVTVDYDPALQQAYLPTTFTHEDYPSLVPEGSPVRTIAVGAVMAVYDWNPEGERYAKVERFINAFFSNFEKFLQAPRHPKWREVNLAAELPGWTRFQPAREWLDRNRQTASAEVRQQFNAFLVEKTGATQLSDEEKDALFSEFVRWRQQRQAAGN